MSVLKKVVTDDDERLFARIPIYIPPDAFWRITANFQAAAVVPIRIHGTLIVDGTLVMM